MPSTVSGWKRGFSFAAIILGYFMALLDSTIVNVVLPEMTGYFHAQMKDMSWVVNGYNLAFAVFLVTASRLADQFGRKKLFMIGVFLFVLFSVLSGLSRSEEALILYRIFQGLAAAIVVPVTIPLAADLFPPRLHGMVIGIWGAISGLAAASGPTLGGILTDYVNWQSIFFVNLPIGLAAIILSFFLLRESCDPSAGKKMDWWGMLSLSTAMFFLTYALIQANDWGWSSVPLIGWVAASFAAFAAFVWIERRNDDPMLPLWLMRILPFTGAILTLLVIGSGIMASTFLMSYFLTGLMGKSVLQAGTIISAMPLASMLFSTIAGALSNRVGSRWFAVAGMALMAVSVYSYGMLDSDSAVFSIVWRLALTGAALGLSYAPVMGSAIRNVPSEKVGIASGVTNMTRALGAVLGVAVLVTVLNGAVADNGKKAKGTIAEIIRSDSVLTNDIKMSLLDKVEHASGSIAAGGGSTAKEEALRELDGLVRQKLAEAPAEKRETVKEAFGKQRAELEIVIDRIGKEIKVSYASSFRRTFHFGGYMLLLGIPLAFISDRRKRPAGVHEMEPVQSA